MASLLLSTFEQIFDAAKRADDAAASLPPDTVGAELVEAARRLIGSADEWLLSCRPERAHAALAGARGLLCTAAQVAREPDPAARSILRAVWQCTRAMSGLDRITVTG